MAVEAQISRDNYSSNRTWSHSWDSIGAQSYRWTTTIELRYVVSRPASPEQLSVVRVQFESVSGHPATSIHDALLEPEWLPW